MGTCGLTPTPAYFSITSARMIRIKSQKNVYLHLWMLETFSPYLRQLRVLVLKRASAVRTIEKMTCTNKLEYVNYCSFFPENELVGCTNYRNFTVSQVLCGGSYTPAVRYSLVETTLRCVLQIDII